VKRALVVCALVAGCNTEVDVTLTFDPATVSDDDVKRLTYFDVTVDGVEHAHTVAAVAQPKRSERILYLPRVSSGTLNFLVGASDPTRTGEGFFAAGTGSVDVEGGHGVPLLIPLYGPGGPGPVDGGTFDGDLAGFGNLDGAMDLFGVDSGPPDLALVKHCASPSVYLCDHFDQSNSLDPQWMVLGNSSIDTTNSRSAPNSFRSQVYGVSGAQASTLAPAPSVRQQMDRIWIRVFVHQGAANPTDHAVFLTATDGNESYGASVNTSGNVEIVHVTSSGVVSSYDVNTNVTMSSSSFECYTLHVESWGSMHFAQVEHNGVIVLTYPNIALGPIYSFSIGDWQQTSSAMYQMNFDDVLVDDQPLTCLQ
jgi:hypothetical protein